MSDWITGNHFLNMEEMKNNATLLGKYFLKKKWSKYAISAMLGNMQTESSINPGIWENLTEFSGGYGLVQWTPYTKYSEWAGDDWQDNGIKECDRIQYEMENGLQWGRNIYAPIPDPPCTFEEFAKNTNHYTIEELAILFLTYYERPDDLDQPERAEQALYWYDEVIKNLSAIPIWLLFKMKENNT